MTTYIYFDGSYRRQTGEMYSAIVCGDYAHIERESADGTSSGHAEWIAALAALEYAADLKRNNIEVKHILIAGDATVVTDQMMHPERLEHNHSDRKEELVEYQKYAEKLSSEIGSVEWGRVSTDENPAGKLLREAHAAGKLRPRGLWG